MTAAGDFIERFFEGLTNIAGNFVDFLVSLFNAVFGLFWDQTSGEGGDLTILGYFLLISLATGFVIWGFNFIRSLIRVRRNG